MRIVTKLFSVLTISLCLTSPMAAQDNPLSFMEPYIGSWVTTGRQGPQNNPDQGQMVGFHFEWTNDSKHAIYFYEGYRPESGDMINENFLTYTH